MPRTQFNEPIQREITLADNVTKVMQGLPNVQVSVYKINEDGSRGALATLYATRGPVDVTPFAGGNPFVTGVAGKTGFWADNGDYDMDFHDLSAPARIGDQTVGWQANSGADRGIKVTQLPEYGRALAPAGAILHYAGTGDPPGWLLCDGRVLAQATYPALYAAIGAAYGLGNEGAGNFRIPDYRGRGIIGQDNMGTAAGAGGRLASLAAGAARSRGAAGGLDAVPLGTNELPAHVHNATATASGTGVSVNGGAGTHGHHMRTEARGGSAVPNVGMGNGWNGVLGDQYSGAGGGDYGIATAGGNGSFQWAIGVEAGGEHSHTLTDPGHGHTITVNDTGQTRGAAHTNLHPYQLSNVIIKT
jgi:microcystin-dependent protein